MKNSAALLSDLLASIFDDENCPEPIRDKGERLWAHIESGATFSPDFIRAALPAALSESELDFSAVAVERDEFPAHLP